MCFTYIWYWNSVDFRPCISWHAWLGHAVRNKDEVLILQYHLWPYNFSHLTEAPPNYLCQINERIPPTQVMGLAVCQEAFWACKSDSSGSDCPTGGCLGEWTPQLSHSEPESFHGLGHLHQAQRPAWAFVGVTRERASEWERERQGKEREEEEGGWGVSDLSHKETK